MTGPPGTAGVVGPAGTDAPAVLFTAPTTGTPLRYVFRNHRGQIINAPTEPAERDPAASG